MKKLNATIILLLFNVTLFNVLNSQIPLDFNAAKTAAKKHEAKKYAKKAAETAESSIDDINVITIILTGIDDIALINSGKVALEIAEKNVKKAALQARLAAEYAKNEAKKLPQQETNEDAQEAEKYAQRAEKYVQELRGTVSE